MVGMETKIYTYIHVCRVSQCRALMHNMKATSHFVLFWGFSLNWWLSSHTSLPALFTCTNGLLCEKINMLICFAIVTIILTIFVYYKIMCILEIQIIKFIKRL